MNIPYMYIYIYIYLFIYIYIYIYLIKEFCDHGSYGPRLLLALKSLEVAVADGPLGGLGGSSLGRRRVLGGSMRGLSWAL